jgi:FkbM family methyltransferase
MRLRAAQHRLTRPVRRIALPVVRGNGRGLRVRFDESALTRAVATVEREVERVFLASVREGDVVYDVGANIGWYSLLAARAVGSGGRVVAFEPSLANAALVQRNAERNHFTNVSVVAAALTDRDGWIPFLDKGNLEGRLDKDDFDAQAQRRARRDQKIKGRRAVPAATLDAWLEQTGESPPSLVKIDVEGSEVGVLRGMTRTLAMSGPTLIIELHGTNAQVADVLDAAGYRHEPVEAAQPTREAPHWVHLLARPVAQSV